MNVPNSDIKSMKLYQHVERVGNELRELGRDDIEPVSVDDLTSFDQLHYHGTDAVDEAIRVTGMDEGSSVLEIGSGLGGPARYMAETSGAMVTALELQEDHHLMGSHLTQRCGLAEKVEHLCGNFLTQPWHGREFDVLVSWLALYHIPERDFLLDRCRSLLRQGGFFFVEDLCEREPLTAVEMVELESELSARCLPSMDRYRSDLVRAGFQLVLFEDMSDDWTEFTSQRLAAYRQQGERHRRVHGEEVFETMCEFYETMVRLFSSGKLGGVRVVVRRV